MNCIILCDRAFVRIIWNCSCWVFNWLYANMYDFEHWSDFTAMAWGFIHVHSWSFMFPLNHEKIFKSFSSLIAFWSERMNRLFRSGLVMGLVMSKVSELTFFSCQSLNHLCRSVCAISWEHIRHCVSENYTHVCVIWLIWLIICHQWKSLRYGVIYDICERWSNQECFIVNKEKKFRTYIIFHLCSVFI